MKKTLRVILGIAALTLAWQGMHGINAARFEYNTLRDARSRPSPPADSARLGLREMAFRAADGLQIRGWYVPSRNGAVVVLAGGSTSDRRAMLPHARALTAGGTGVILFDWPGCGASDGRAGAGRHEIAALRGAIDFGASLPELRDGRLAVIGFSMGGWAAMLEGATDLRVRAFAVEGVFDDPWTQTRAEYRQSGTSAQWGAVLGAWIGGLERPTLHAIQAAPRLAPRPLLVVTGDADQSVPPALTQRVYDAAAAPKTLWHIGAATHGSYFSADTTYGRRLRAFIEQALSIAPAGGSSATPVTRPS